MTSISAASASTYQSPLQRLQDELQSEVTSGTISSADQDALSSALTDIDSSLQAGRTSDQASGTKPGDLKSKIDDLINSEVSSGKLTGDQATELQGVFKAAFANGPGGADGAGGVGAADGPRWRRRYPSRPPRRLRRCVGFLFLGRQLQQHDLDQRCPAAVLAVAAGLAVFVVVDHLQFQRQHEPGWYR
jgi:hypothetical protein